MNLLKLLLFIQVFSSSSPIYTIGELYDLFIDFDVNPTNEINPLQLCDKVTDFYASPEGKLIDVLVSSLIHIPNQSRYIAEGGFGKVYKINYNNEPAAVKIINRAKAGDLIKTELFYWIDMYVNYPEDAVEFKFCLYDNTYYYLVSELMDGDLTTVLDDFSSAFDMKQQLKMLYRMQTTLAHIQKLRIVHHDIKPENFLIRYRNPDDYDLKIADFGLAEERMEENSVVGTELFLPPEAFQGQFSFKNKRGDTWAMGMTFLNLYMDEIELADPCYKVQYTAKCHKKLMDKITAFFSTNFGLKDRTNPITKCYEAQNVMEVIKLMLSYFAVDRPKPDDVLKKLEYLAGKARLLV